MRPSSARSLQPTTRFQSSTTAANVGIFTTGEDPTPPDFFIPVIGVGGETSEVPGYYLNQISLTSTSGQIKFSRAPVIVLDVPDPRNPNQTLPGVLGTNLLTSRDLVINVGTGNSFLYVSPFTTESVKLFPQFKKWGFDTVEIPVEAPEHIDPAKVKAAADKAVHRFQSRSRAHA